MTVTNDLPDWAQVVAQPDTPLAGSPTLYTSGPFSQVYTLPNGVHLLSIIIPDFADVTSLTVVGENTGITYLSVNPSTSVYQHQYYVLISSVVEGSVQIATTASVAGNMWITGLSYPAAIASLAQGPAPWEAPTAPSMAVFFGNPGPSTTHTVIPAPGTGKSIYLHTFVWEWDTANTGVTGVFQDTAAVGVASTSATVAGFQYGGDLRGVKLTTSAGLQFSQTGGAAVNASNCRGLVTYSVY